MLLSNLDAPPSRAAIRKILPVLLVLATLLSVRVLTLMFMRAHLDDPAWFQTGSYGKFDRQARDILDGRQPIFLIDDPTRTDLAQYPPAFPAAVAAIYGVTGERSAYSVQLVQWADRPDGVVGIDRRNYRYRIRLASRVRSRFSR